MEGIMMSRTMSNRRPRWQYPQPLPTPRILHLPRRPRRKQTKHSPGKTTSQREKNKGVDKLENLFDQERSFGRGVVPVVLMRPGESEERRERVEEGERGGLVAVEEEKWRFQAEMLRAECNLLRMEREIAIKKMERRRVKMERLLRSAIHTLLSGRKKVMEGNNVEMVIEEEISELVEKLKMLQKQSKGKDLECKNCSNFEKKAYFLQSRLHKSGSVSDEEETCVKEIREMAESTLSIKTNDQNNDPNRSSNVEILRRKMEGLSKGMLLEKVVEEYGSVISSSRSNSSAASSISSSRRTELFPDNSMLSIQQSYKYKEKSCSGSCKVIVRRVLEQVRAETEQWSQMQDMLGQVRNEIEELQASRDSWEHRALDLGNEKQSLQYAVEEWKEKAVSSEAKANELEEQVSMLQGEIERLSKGKERKLASRTRNIKPLPQEAQKESEKRVLVCHSKENGHARVDIRRRAPLTYRNNSVILRDIGNMPSSPLSKQQNKAMNLCYKEEMRQGKGVFLP